MSENWPFIQVDCVPPPPIQALGQIWAELESRSVSSFFNSWVWVGPWLAHLPENTDRYLLQASCSGRIVGLAVLCKRTVRRARVIPSRTIFIHCTGDPELDELTVEHNRHLAETGLELAVARAFGLHLLQRTDWDEVSFLGWSGDTWMTHGMGLQLRDGTVQSWPCHIVDLGRLRRENVEYVSLLSASVRHKIRRTLKEAERHGSVQLEAAASTEEALEFLSRLEQFHQKSWTARGKPGSFANLFFKRFHEDLVRRESATGRIQLIRLNVGGQGIGYLYNMIHQGHVLQYQSGFDYEFSDSPAWRPGIICHALAVEHYLSMGMETYDFLAGGARQGSCRPVHAAEAFF